jgi:hypothetical protein
MSNLLDLTVHGDPGACRRAADDLRDARCTANGAITDVGAAVRAAGTWHGLAGVAFEDRVTILRRDLVRLDKRLGILNRALLDFAGELGVVRARMAKARRIAVAGGVLTCGDLLVRPVAPVQGTPEQVSAHNAIVEAWTEAVEIADDARTKETEAHAHLGIGITKSTGDGFVVDVLQRLGVLPPDFADGDDLTAWLLGLGGLGAGAAADWMVHARYGVFQPRINGKFSSARGMTFWQRAWAARNPDNFHAKPYSAAARNRWSAAGKWMNRAGAGIAGISAGWNQWQADADDPSRDTGERGARAATVGTTTMVGALGGAKLGGTAGAAIGTAIFPGAGTVVGAAVGGVVGGAVGGMAGTEVGEAIIDRADDVGKWAGNAAKGVADWGSDRLSDAGDALSDLGDKLTFWD